MTSDSNTTLILDEIDRLFVSHEKAHEYLTKISTGIQQHADFWQNRRAVIADEMRSASMDLFLPKVQRMNELIIEAVQNLCRVDLLIEQLVQLEPKLPTVHQTQPITNSFSARSIDRMSSTSTNYNRFPSPAATTSTVQRFPQAVVRDTNSSPRMMNQTVLPVPVFKRPTQTATIAQVPPPTSSGRMSTTTVGSANESGFFKTIDQQSQYPYPENPSSRMTRDIPKSNVASASGASSNFRTSTDSEKVRVKLQRIRPNTRWLQARIRVVDSLSAFYVENLDRKVHDEYCRLFDELDHYYDDSKKSKRLRPLQGIAIGDFGATKSEENNHWYRARVVASEENDRVQLLDIDSGNLESKFIDEFYQLDPRFVSLPAKAVACTLSEACPLGDSGDNTLWATETIDIFRKEVVDKMIEIHFVEGGGDQSNWPLHFVRIIVNNQSVTNLLSLKKHIHPKPNSFIAEQLSETLKEAEYILFNVPIGDDVYEGNQWT